MAAEKGEEAAPANEREEMEKRIQHRRERIKEWLEINIFFDNIKLININFIKNHKY